MLKPRGSTSLFRKAASRGANSAAFVPSGANPGHQARSLCLLSMPAFPPPGAQAEPAPERRLAFLPFPQSLGLPRGRDPPARPPAAHPWAHPLPQRRLHLCATIPRRASSPALTSWWGCRPGRGEAAGAEALGTLLVARQPPSVRPSHPRRCHRLPSLRLSVSLRLPPLGGPQQ